MKKIQFLVATILLLTAALVWADKPDPTPNPPLSVAVENTPDVNVATMPDINVASMPDINIANAPDVNVANTQPLSVIVANEPEKVPYRAFDWNVVGEPTVEFDVVPTGKRLHIEHVALYTSVDTGSVAWCYLQVSEDGGDPQVGLLPIVIFKTEPSDGGSDWHIGSMPVTMHVEAGEYPVVQCYIRPLDDSPLIKASITGYMVDLP